MPRDPNFLNEEEAARLWQRAAQLQAEAAQKAEALAEESESEKADGDPPEGYALTHVRSAALEVGIGGEFVDAALADLRAERALREGKRGWRLARRILHHSPDTIKVRRIIEAPAADVLSAMWDVFPREPYRLAMTHQTADPLEGGVLVFDIQGLNSPFPEGLALEARHAGIRQVFLSLRAIDGATPSCEVTLRGPVDLSHNIGVGLVSAGGAAAGVLGLSMVLGPVGLVLGAVLTVGGVVVGGGLGVKGYRALYGYGIRRGRRALEGLLGAVAGRAQGGWGVTSPKGSEPPTGLSGSSNPTG